MDSKVLEESLYDSEEEQAVPLSHAPPNLQVNNEGTNQQQSPNLISFPTLPRTLPMTSLPPTNGHIHWNAALTANPEDNNDAWSYQNASQHERISPSSPTPLPSHTNGHFHWDNPSVYPVRTPGLIMSSQEKQHMSRCCGNALKSSSACCSNHLEHCCRTSRRLENHRCANVHNVPCNQYPHKHSSPLSTSYPAPSFHPSRDTPPFHPSRDNPPFHSSRIAPPFHPSRDTPTFHPSRDTPPFHLSRDTPPFHPSRNVQSFHPSRNAPSFYTPPYVANASSLISETVNAPLQDDGNRLKRSPHACYHSGCSQTICLDLPRHVTSFVDNYGRTWTCQPERRERFFAPGQTRDAVDNVQRSPSTDEIPPSIGDLSLNDHSKSVECFCGHGITRGEHRNCDNETSKSGKRQRKVSRGKFRDVERSASNSSERPVRKRSTSEVSDSDIIITTNLNVCRTEDVSKRSNQGCRPKTFSTVNWTPNHNKIEESDFLTGFDSMDRQRSARNEPAHRNVNTSPQSSTDSSGLPRTTASITSPVESLTSLSRSQRTVHLGEISQPFDYGSVYELLLQDANNVHAMGDCGQEFYAHDQLDLSLPLSDEDEETASFFLPGLTPQNCRGQAWFAAGLRHREDSLERQPRPSNRDGMTTGRSTVDEMISDSSTLIINVVDATNLQSARLNGIRPVNNNELSNISREEHNVPYIGSQRTNSTGINTNENATSSNKETTDNWRNNHLEINTRQARSIAVKREARNNMNVDIVNNEALHGKKSSNCLSARMNYNQSRSDSINHTATENYLNDRVNNMSTNSQRTTNNLDSRNNTNTVENAGLSYASGTCGHTTNTTLANNVTAEQFIKPKTHNVGTNTKDKTNTTSSTNSRRAGPSNNSLQRPCGTTRSLLDEERASDEDTHMATRTRLRMAERREYPQTSHNYPPVERGSLQEVQLPRRFITFQAQHYPVNRPVLQTHLNGRRANGGGELQNAEYHDRVTDLSRYQYNVPDVRTAEARLHWQQLEAITYLRAGSHNTVQPPTRFCQYPSFAAELNLLQNLEFNIAENDSRNNVEKEDGSRRMKEEAGPSESTENVNREKSPGDECNSDDDNNREN